MKTTEVTPYHFSAKFGSEHIASGSFTYYECDNGLGIIKDNVKQTIRLVGGDDIALEELSPEDEFALLARISGEFKPDIRHPANDTLTDYESREMKASRQHSLSITIIAAILFLCMLFTLLLYSYLSF